MRACVCEVCVTGGVCVCVHTHMHLCKDHLCFTQNRKVNMNMGAGENRTVFSQT